MDTHSQEILETLGFTRAEALTYLSLLGIGPSKVGKIIEKSGLQSSTVHNTLLSLIEKGYVSYVEQERTKTYHASHPSLIKKHAGERLRAFDTILPILEAQRESYRNQTKTQVYEGFKGIYAMLLSLLENSKPGDPHWFFATAMEGASEEIQKFFSRYDIHRIEKKLDVRGVVPMHQKTFFKPRGLNVRYFDFPIPGNINLAKDKMTLITWGVRPTGILIHSPQLVAQQMAFFEQLWKLGKK